MVEYHLLHNKYIKGSVLHFTISDEDVSDSLKTQIAERDIYYTELLKDHISLTRIRGKCKEFHKWIFFWLLIIVSGIGVSCIQKVFKTILASEDISVIIDAIPIMITAFVSLISTIVVIPVTIAKFLFNTKEDDNITSLIQHTQDHDSSGISLFKERFMPKGSKAAMTQVDTDEQ